LLGRYLALSKDVLKRQGKRRLFDLVNAEVILPVAEGVQVPVRQRVRYVLDLNVSQVSTLKAPSEGLAWCWRVRRKITRRDFVITSAVTSVCLKRPAASKAYA
jgi:hypothetical protein